MGRFPCAAHLHSSEAAHAHTGMARQAAQNVAGTRLARRAGALARVTRVGWWRRS
jgi:hypothetical protein